MPGLESLEKQPDTGFVDMYLKYFQSSGVFVNLYKEFVSKHSAEREFVINLAEITREYKPEEIAGVLLVVCYSRENRNKYKNLVGYIQETLEGVLAEKEAYNLSKEKYVDYLELTVQ